MKPLLALRKSLTLCKIVFQWLAENTYKTDYERNRDQWYRDGCDDTLRYQFSDLTSKSIVFDLGGWKGDWASNIYSRYRCNLFVFEAVPSFAAKITDRFKLNPDVKVYPFGLGAQQTSVEVFSGHEGSSIFNNRNTTSHHETGKIVEIGNYLNSLDLKKIDLMKINIEGGEYELIEKIIELDLVEMVDCYLVQFHDFVPNFSSRREKIREKLKESHQLIFDYPFVWECWKKNKFS